MTNINTTIRGQHITLLVDNDSLLEWSSWKHEPEILDFIDALDPQKDVFADLGACEGRFALYAASKGIFTYAVEPERNNFQALSTNKTLNKLDNLTLIDKAVGAFAHPSKIVLGSNWAGGHNKAIADTAGRCDLSFGFGSIQDVDVVTTDELFKTAKVTAMKVDIDGSENEFMAGATQLLARPEMQNLMFELCKVDRAYHSILRQLNYLGFYLHKEFEIEPNLFNIWFKKDNGR